jgi:hypothetical protein
MLGIIIGIVALIGIVVAVVCSVFKTPEHLRGYYGKMFITIAVIAVAAIAVLATLGVI